MGGTVLGKRTRGLALNDPELPAKRARGSRENDLVKEGKGKSARAIAIQPPDAFEDQENRNPIVECADLPVAAPPSRRRTKQALAAVTSKQPYNPITPQTPRHYDVFAKTSSTPRHRVMSAGKLSRRLTPQTPLTPTTCQTVYHQARQLFSRSADPGQLIGRDDERIRLLKFLSRCSSAQPSGCIYVSGPPGTGKSAMVYEATESIVRDTPSVRKAYINCMSIKSSKELYVALLGQLCKEAEEDIARDDAVNVLQKLFVPKSKSGDVQLVVLDEIDHILTLDLDSLYRLFEWSLQKSSRLVLVGIANALDLTDRFLPRLKSRNLKPELLPFLPYTALQVKNIITARLKSLMPDANETPGYVPFFHPAAIELCSRKVSTQTGDLRKAFEICRRAIDLIELETRQKHEMETKERHSQMTPSRKALGENTNLASSPRVGSSQGQTVEPVNSLQGLTVETAPRVSIAHLNKVTAAAFSNGTSQRLKTLNLQQKAALCSLMAIENRNRAAKVSASGGLVTPSKPRVAAPTIKMLFDNYCLLCTRDSVLHPLSSSEFREVVGSLETLSLIAPVDGRTGSLAAAVHTPSKRGRKPGGFGKGTGVGDEMRVASCVGEREIESAVEGLGADILKSILSGEALD